MLYPAIPNTLAVLEFADGTVVVPISLHGPHPLHLSCGLRLDTPSPASTSSSMAAEIASIAVDDLVALAARHGMRVANVLTLRSSILVAPVSTGRVVS
jgi:hypothetical protein